MPDNDVDPDKPPRKRYKNRRGKRQPQNGGGGGGGGDGSVLSPAFNMSSPMLGPRKTAATPTVTRVTLSDSFKIRPRTKVSSLLIVQPVAKIQCPEPRVARTTLAPAACCSTCWGL